MRFHSPAAHATPGWYQYGGSDLYRAAVLLSLTFTFGGLLTSRTAWLLQASAKSYRAILDFIKADEERSIIIHGSCSCGESNICLLFNSLNLWRATSDTYWEMGHDILWNTDYCTADTLNLCTYLENDMRKEVVFRISRQQSIEAARDTPAAPAVSCDTGWHSSSMWCSRN